MFFNQENRDRLFFEDLHIRHLNLLIDLKDNKENNLFYKMAIINTFDDLKIFLNSLEKNKNKFIIAIKNRKIVGYLYIHPINVKKTCLKINSPVIIANDNSISRRYLLIELIRKSISNTDIKTSSWFISPDIYNQELVSCGRELGFQPSQEIKLWEKGFFNIKKFKEFKKNQINNYEPINKSNIKKVLNFIRSNESILIRNLIDLEQEDIHKRNDNFCGVITNNHEINFVIIKDSSYRNKEVYSLIGGICWDERINLSLKLVIGNLIEKNPNIIFKTYEKDGILNEYLKDLNLELLKQEITLIRNTLIKREVKSGMKLNKSFESILDKINPQNNPYPSPFPIKLN